MTKTLEKIKGMNIPVGAPIELTLKNPDKTNYKSSGYFEGIEVSGDVGVIKYNTQIGKHKSGNDNAGFGAFISGIEDIKILQYPN